MSEELSKRWVCDGCCKPDSADEPCVLRSPEEFAPTLCPYHIGEPIWVSRPPVDSVGVDAEKVRRLIRDIVEFVGDFNDDVLENFVHKFIYYTGGTAPADGCEGVDWNHVQSVLDTMKREWAELLDALSQHDSPAPAGQQEGS